MTTKTKQRESWKRTEITTVLSIVEQIFPRYFEGYLGFVAIFQSIYFFIPLFIAEPWLGNAGLRQVSFYCCQTSRFCFN
jgi:hypothetical protein